jgi:hypothetical protein
VKDDREHVIDELSVFIDGRTADPDRIRRHLQYCEACARHHMQLKKLSARMRTLPAPAPEPAFTAQVMSRVAAAAAAKENRHRFPRRPLPAFAGLSLALAAVLTVLLAGALLILNPAAVEAPAVPARAAAVPAPAPVPISDEEVIGRLEDMLSAGTDLTAFELAAWDQPLPEYFAGVPQSEIAAPAIELSMEEIADLLAFEAEETPPVSGGVIPGEGDFFGMIANLNKEEEAYLQEELRAWIAEGSV